MFMGKYTRQEPDTIYNLRDSHPYKFLSTTSPYSVADPNLSCLRSRQSIPMALLSFFLLVVLLAVARPVESLECTVCAMHDIHCTAFKPMECTSGEDSCISVEDRNGLAQDLRFRLGSAKKCVVAAQHVNKSFMFDFGDGRSLEIASRICSDMNCQASFDYVYMEHFLNGKYCPKCYSPGYSSCEDKGTVLCRGDFLKCAVINGEMSEGETKIPFAAKGCARTDYDGDISEKAPVTIASGSYTYKFVQVSFRAANGAFAALRRIGFTLDGNDLGSQVAFFFPCILGFFAVNHFS